MGWGVEFFISMNCRWSIIRFVLKVQLRADNVALIPKISDRVRFMEREMISGVS